ncbi:MAG: methionyl-tRNA formyltransferase [Lautropia sp.]|nr:methionyl-tRNA formyltransferase [Lautropia sp.]
MRVVFAGTPAFAAEALDALLASRHPVVAVLSQPDRPAGRGQKLLPSAVKQRAVAAGVPVYQPHSLRIREATAHETAAQAQLREARNQEAEACLAALRALQPDVMVVAAYGLLLPQVVLDLPRLGCLNIHASLLPRWRGAAPIVRAIEAGDVETGVGIMQMEAALDTGPVGLERRIPITDEDTATSLHDRLAHLGADAIVQALDALMAGGLDFKAQSAEGVTYARKIDKAEMRINWHQDAVQLSRHIRAFDPPGAFTQLAGQASEGPLKVFEPLVLAAGMADDGRAEGGQAASVAPGTILAVGPEGVDVACGQGVLRLRAMQRPGGRRQPVDAFVRGHPLKAGDQFLSVPAA